MLGVDVSQDIVGYSFCGGILGSIVEADGLGGKACNDVFFVFLNVDVFSLQEVFEKGKDRFNKIEHSFLSKSDDWLVRVLHKFFKVNLLVHFTNYNGRVSHEDLCQLPDIVDVDMIWLNENSLAIAVQEALPHIVYHSALHGPKISTRLDN